MASCCHSHSLMTDWNAVPIFGVADTTLPRVIRPSAYAIIAGSPDRLAIVHTPAGVYLPGGGIMGLISRSGAPSSARTYSPPADPDEPDHLLTWAPPTKALSVLTPPSHRWAVAEWLADED